MNKILRLTILQSEAYTIDEHIWYGPNIEVERNLVLNHIYFLSVYVTPFISFLAVDISDEEYVILRMLYPDMEFLSLHEFDKWIIARNGPNLEYPELMWSWS